MTPDEGRGRVRVAYLVGDLGPGGAERQVVLLAASLDRSRFEPTLVVWRDRRFYAREIEAAKIPVLHVRKGGRFDGAFPFRLRSALLAGGFGVWHGWLEAGSFWARTLSRGLPAARRPAVIASFRCTEMRRGYRRLEPFLQRFTDATVVNGEAVRDELVSLCGADAARVLLSENAIDLARFFRDERPERAAVVAARRDPRFGEGGAPPGALPWVALPGRIAPQKDPLTFVRAAAAARDAGRPFAALLAGDGTEGPLALEARALARTLGVADRVRILPPFPAVERLYDAVDAVAFPTLYEGFPNVLVETVAAGLPVAASDIPQCRAALAGYSRARFAKTGDAPALAAAVAAALDSRPAPAGERRALLARFSPERMARDAESLYERWAGTRRGAASPDFEASLPLVRSSEAK